MTRAFSRNGSKMVAQACQPVQAQVKACGNGKLSGGRDALLLGGLLWDTSFFS